MCCCGKQNVNGQPGYSWDGQSFSIRPVNPPDLQDGETLIYDEPGRCGGIDSHCHHYRVFKRNGSLILAVRHGGGDERIRLSLYKQDQQAVFDGLDSNTRYWLLNAIFHAHSDGARDARAAEGLRWRTAAAEKRIKTRKFRGGVDDSCRKVWIEPRVGAAVQS